MGGLFTSGFSAFRFQRLQTPSSISLPCVEEEAGEFHDSKGLDNACQQT
jgi:hypothetical protein